MGVEYIRYTVPPARAEDFEAAYRRAGQVWTRTRTAWAGRWLVARRSRSISWCASSGTRSGVTSRAAHDRADHDMPLSAEPVGPTSAASAAQWGGRLWELARAATELRCRRLDVAGLGEAAAALQDLALGFTDETSRTSRVVELAALQAETPQQIQAVPDGPYLMTNPEHLYDHLGVPIPTRPLMALCRCGESLITPTCDGTCHQVGFTTAKDPNRVTDRRDSYVGQSVTVLDNRGTCQHSGLCTDRLASVFHLGEEPFVTPSGGRLDEIVRAVRDCGHGRAELCDGHRRGPRAGRLRGPA